MTVTLAAGLLDVFSVVVGVVLALTGIAVAFMGACGAIEGTVGRGLGGVEDETLACGTGMVACAVLHHLLTRTPSPVRIDVAGGDTLEIGFKSSGENRIHDVTLTGPADFVFDGEIEI